jgi:hypothetical protein
MRDLEAVARAAYFASLDYNPEAEYERDFDARLMSALIALAERAGVLRLDSEGARWVLRHAEIRAGVMPSTVARLRKMAAKDPALALRYAESLRAEIMTPHGGVPLIVEETP